MKGAGVGESDIEIQRSCEMRYIGQGHEIEVAVPSGRLGREAIPVIQENYDKEYQRLFQRVNPGYMVECLNWRVVARGPKPKLDLKRFPSDGRTLDQAIKGSRRVYLHEFGEYRPCTVYDRYALFQGATFDGPAIVEERESTTVVGQDGHVSTDQYLNLVIELRS